MKRLEHNVVRVILGAEDNLPVVWQFVGNNFNHFAKVKSAPKGQASIAWRIASGRQATTILKL
jgi:hypothetical protein